jgi:hypothetical protein
VTCYHGVAFEPLFVQSEIGRTVSYECVQFTERAVIEKTDQTFTGCEFAALVL